MGIDRRGRMPYISGCQAGKLFRRQEWGHPVYNWLGEEKRRKLMELWKLRLKYAASIYDWVRIDAGVRFFEYEKLRVGDPKKDRSVRGPGGKVLKELVRYARRLRLRVFVEDISDFDMSKLRQVMKDLRVPGVWVLALELVGKEKEWSKDFFYLRRLGGNRVYYSSNHDSLPLTGLIRSITHGQRRTVGKVVGVSGTVSVERLAKGVRRYLMKNCRMLVLPLQDWLLTGERINTPGTVGEHNWSYRMSVPVEELGGEFEI
jgi:4-alpha-glucanotransferase